MAYYVGNVCEYKIVRTNHDYVVINTVGEYKHHSHFKTLDACYRAIRYIQQGRVPKSAYMVEAVRRLTMDERLIQALACTQPKQKYNRRRYARNSFR